MEKAIKERRLTELRAIENEEKMIVEGYAVVFDSITDLGWSKEVIDRNAFNGCDMSDVCMKYNHEDNVLIMARTRNNSLQLIIDDRGLKVRAELIDTQNNKDYEDFSIHDEPFWHELLHLVECARRGMHSD